MISHEMASLPLLPSDTVVDIGAHEGVYVRHALGCGVRWVRAFEPTPGHKFPPDPRLTVVQAAVVGDNRSQVTLYVKPGVGMRNSLIAFADSQPLQVAAVPYEWAVQGASVVKVDVEGAEYDYTPLVQDSIRAFVIDFHWNVTDWRDKADAMIEELEDAGFRAIVQPSFVDGLRSAGSWVR